MNNFKDTTTLFVASISQFLRLDEEYRKNWRYKHQQDRLKAPRREALAHARAYAEKIREYMEGNTQPNTIERYAGKTYQAWLDYMLARDANIDATQDQRPTTLKALKEAETSLKAQMRGINALLAAQ